jgi:hypothetical protein
MAVQSANTLLMGEAFMAIRQNVIGWKAQAQSVLASLAGGSVNSDFVFYQVLDPLRGVITALQQWEVTASLDTYAAGQGYAGTMSADCAARITAAQACIAWIVANFPASGGFLQSHTLNADGSRTPRSFTSAQTAGLQTALTSFIATLG